MKFRLPGTPLERLMANSVENLTRLACIVALIALAVMVASILHPGPLLIIFATSVGQAIFFLPKSAVSISRSTVIVSR